MNTKVKSNSVITHAIAGTVITFNVRDAGSFTLDMAALAPAVRDRAAVHGIIQRVSDRAAIGRDTETGKSASPADKLARMKELADHYASGSPEWSMRVSATGGAAESGITLRAVANVSFGGDVEKARERIAGLASAKSVEPREILTTLRSSDKVGAEIARLRAEGANGKAAEDMLGELMG